MVHLGLLFDDIDSFLNVLYIVVLSDSGLMEPSNLVLTIIDC